MAYTTKAKVETFLGGITIPASFDIATLITWVQGYIDSYLGFPVVAVSSDYYYDGNGSDEIVTDPFIGTPTVVLLNPDGSAMRTLTVSDSGDIVTGPYNTTEKFLLKTTRVGTLSAFPKRRKCIKVTANFGLAATVPADIEMVTTKLVAELYDQKTNRGKLTRVSLGDYEEMYAQIDERAQIMGATDVLDGYRHIQL